MSLFKRMLLIIAVALGAIIVQSWAHWAMPSLVVPDLILVIVVFLSFYEVSQWGALLVFTIGLIFDMSSGVLLGPRAGASVVVFGFLSSMSQRIFIESPIAAMVCVFCASVVNHLIYVILVFEFKQDEVITWSHFLGFRVIAEGFMTAIVAPPFMRFLRKLFVRGGASAASRLAGVK